MFYYRAIVLRRATDEDVYRLSRVSATTGLASLRSSDPIDVTYTRYVLLMPAASSVSEVLAYALTIPGLVSAYQTDDVVLVGQLGDFVIMGALENSVTSGGIGSTRVALLSVSRLRVASGEFSGSVTILDRGRSTPLGQLVDSQLAISTSVNDLEDRCSALEARVEQLSQLLSELSV